MKKPSEMTVGLIAAVMAVGTAMWIDEANAGDTHAQTPTTTEKKRKPKASEVSSGKAMESKPLDEAVSDTAKEKDAEFREGYGGSGKSTGVDDGKTDTKDVGRKVRKAEDTTKELGSELKKDAKAADKGYRAGYHDEKNDAPRREAAEAKDEIVEGEKPRTDSSDLGYELGKSARRLEEAAAEAAAKLRGEAKKAEDDFERGYEEEKGYGGSGDAGTTMKGDAGTAKGSADAGTPAADGGTPTKKGKVEVKLKTGTK